MMPVKKDASGRRFVQAEVEVPGTPEDVWQAIATGQGVSSWFVPTRIEGRVGGAVTANFGPGMDSVSTITAWDPPRRFAADSRDDMGPGDPTIATEWTVEARAGGTCLVRVVHSWFATSDDWDNQFEGHEQGWVAFFRILQLYLAHFRSQPSSLVQFVGMTPASPSDAWKTLTRGLAVAGASKQQRVTSPASAPRLGGIVERVGPPADPEMLIRLDSPTAGIAHMFAMTMGGQTCLAVRLYLYGDQAASVAPNEDAAWQAWMNQQFPQPASEVAESSQGAP